MSEISKHSFTPNLNLTFLTCSATIAHAKLWNRGLLNAVATDLPVEEYVFTVRSLFFLVLLNSKPRVFEYILRGFPV
jgi:hypothetical protein